MVKVKRDMRQLSGLAHDAVAAGVPKPIAQWIAAFPTDGGAIYRNRLQRFVAHWRSHPDEETTKKAWAKIERAAPTADALIMLFLTLPDEPTKQPFPALFGRRAVDPDIEQERYKDRLNQVRGVLELISPHRPEFLALMRDATATSEGAKAAFEYRAIDQNIGTALQRLVRLLENVDPFAKYPTKHWKATDSAIKIYTWCVADLTRHMLKPIPWTALATLANINCSKCTLTGDALRKVSGRAADKTH